MYIPEDSSIREGVMSAPPAAVAAVSLSGVSLQDWVLIATLVWLGLQVSWFCYNRIKEFFPKKGDT